MSRFTRFSLLAIGLWASMFLLGSCDVPTQPPNFGAQSPVRSPLLFEETFTLLGTGTSDSEALIDTALADYDTLFTTGENQALSITQDINNLNVGDLDGILPSFDVPATDLSFAIQSLTEQQLFASFSEPIGTIRRPALAFPASPVLVENDQVFAPFPSEVIAPDEINLVNLGNVQINTVTLTPEGDGLNALRFTLSNQLEDEPLTDGSGNPPDVVIVREDGGEEVARESFEAAPGPGETATAVLSLAGRTLPLDVRFRLDLSTPVGFQPIRDNQSDVRTALNSDAFAYESLTPVQVPEQDDIALTDSNATLVERPGFRGLTASGGTLELTVTNNFPFDVTLEQFAVKNTVSVGSYPAGHTALQDRRSHTLPAGATTEITLELGETGISRVVDIQGRATSSGTSGPTTIEAQDGLSLSLSVEDVTIDQVFVRPNGLTFSNAGTISLGDLERVDFGPGDYVEFRGGALTIEGLTNELSVGLKSLRMSLPGLRTPAHQPRDSVVVRFEGNRRDPENFVFPKLEPTSGPRDASIDLSNLRLYPAGNRLPYHLNATSETTGEVRAIDTDDRISAEVGARNLKIQAFRGQVKSFTAPVTSDANDDGRLDVGNDAEAEITTLDLSAIQDLNLRGLRLPDGRLTLNFTTNLTPDVTAYAAIVGKTPSGRRVHLGGRGPYAVQTDSIAEDFAGLAADQLIKLPIDGAPSPDQFVTRSLTLSRENSNVGTFAGSLPSEIRFAGKVLVRTGGRRLSLRRPLQLNASLAATLPLALSGEATLSPTVDADLSSLDGLTGEGNAVSLRKAQLRLEYENGLPVGFGVRLKMLNASGDTLLTLPSEGEPLAIERAGVVENGMAQNATSGTVLLDLSDEQLRTLSEIERIQPQLTLRTPEDRIARLRSTDALRLGLEGRFDVRAKIGD